MKPRIALVVPGLADGGGVPAVAAFLHATAARSGCWEAVPISLCMSSVDAESTSVRRPASWFSSPGAGRRTWQGLAVPHVGARFGELEFQRYRPRRSLTRMLAECDVIQVVCGSPAWANAVTGAGKPVAMHVATRARVERRRRDAAADGLAPRWRKAMTGVTDRLDDRALRSVSAVQVMNPWMLDYAREVNRDRGAIDIRYAPPGIDAIAFHPPVARTPGTRRTILCVGRLDDPRKRVDLLLDAFALVAADDPGARLLLAGSAGPGEAFWRRAGQLGLRGRIGWTPRPTREELIALYQQASVFVLPSDEEGFGVVLLEAMACGVPVVATRCGGPEGIIADGRDGFLVPREDARALADRIQRLHKDSELNLAMGARARRTVERRYELAIAGAVFLDIWRGLLRGSA